MALKKALSHRGLEVPQGYIRVDRLNGGKAMGFHVEAGIYASKGQTQPLDVVTASFDYDPAKDVYVQAYAAVKALPQFSDALDD